MDFGYTPQNEAFRQEVRQFIVDNVTPALREELAQGRLEGRGPLTKALFRKLGSKGWIGMSWPKEYGGQERDLVEQYIFEEEFVRAGIPLDLNNILEQAPAIMRAGTEEQKKYFLPRLVSGEVIFALGYTEPSGGTDLASLRTRAEEDGDEYVINGQKMFTSGAHYCTHVYLMARTDPDLPKHRGISIFLLPIDTPGITVRPLWTLTGGRTNEVFLENVRVPKTALLGEKNQGWYVGQKSEALTVRFETLMTPRDVQRLPFGTPTPPFGSLAVPAALESYADALRALGRTSEADAAAIRASERRSEFERILTKRRTELPAKQPPC